MITHYTTNRGLPVLMIFYFPVLSICYSFTTGLYKPYFDIFASQNRQNHPFFLFPCSIRQLAVEVVEGTGGKKVTIDTQFLQ